MNSMAECRFRSRKNMFTHKKFINTGISQKNKLYPYLKIVLGL